YDYSDPKPPVPFSEPVGKATLRSMANDNSRYFLQLRAATNFTVHCRQIHLIVGETTILFNSQGEGPGGFTSMETTIDDAKLVPKLAEYFHTVPIDRHHPGYKILVAFTPQKKEFARDEPITVTLGIT